MILYAVCMFGLVCYKIRVDILLQLQRQSTSFRITFATHRDALRARAVGVALVRAARAATGATKRSGM